MQLLTVQVLRHAFKVPEQSKTGPRLGLEIPAHGDSDCVAVRWPTVSKCFSGTVALPG